MPTTIPGTLILQSPADNDPLLDLNTQPSLDLQFATSKTLDDRVSGLPLVDHQRDVSSGKSAGTYVDGDGLIKTSTVNLLTYSEEFDNSAWIKTNVALDTTVAAPNGGLSAQKIKENSTTNSLHSVNISTATLMNGVYTFSVYAKASERSIIALNFTYANGVFSTSDPRAWFNLSNGTVGTTLNASDATIDPVGSSGWYRCTLVSGSFSGANRKVLVATSIADGSVTHNGDGTSGIYLWGAQLEEGSTATDYTPTTNLPSAAPRFDHDPVTGESLGLLIEEARTNLLINSSTLDGYTPSSIASKTPNAGIAPDGTNTAVLGTTISNGSDSNLRENTSQATNTTYTYSFFAKPGTVDYAVVYNISKNNVGLTWFNVADGTIGTTASGVTPFIESAGNGWYRVGVTQTTDATITNNLVDIRWAPEDGVFSTTAGENLYVWGAQLEEGSFPTSYIPTDGTPGGIARAADVAEITGTNFSRWYNQGEGTVFAEGSGEGPRLVGINDGTDSNRHELFIAPTNIQVFQKNNGVNEVNMSLAKASKASFAYALDNYGFSAGGSSVVTDTSATPPTVNKMTIGNWYNNTGQLNGHIKRLAYYPYRLGDTTLQEITS